MDKHSGRTGENVEKKIYVEPRLEKANRIQDVTEGVTPVVTGAPLPT